MFFQRQFGTRKPRRRTHASTGCKIRACYPYLQDTVSKLLASFFKEDKTRRELDNHLEISAITRSGLCGFFFFSSINLQFWLLHLTLSQLVVMRRFSWQICSKYLSKVRSGVCRTVEYRKLNNETFNLLPHFVPQRLLWGHWNKPNLRIVTK